MEILNLEETEPAQQPVEIGLQDLLALCRASSMFAAEIGEGKDELIELIDRVVLSADEQVKNEK